MLAEAVVKTTGINWESVTTIAASVIIIVGTITGWFTRQITNAIANLSKELQLKLETKDVVNGINLRLTSVEAKISDLSATIQRDRT